MTIATALPHHGLTFITADEAPAAGLRFARVLRPFFAMVAFFALTSTGARAQTTAGNDVTLSIGGLVQAETSVGWVTNSDDERSRIGFGLRRTRLLVSAGLGPKFGAFIHVDGDGGSFGVLDAYASYQANPRVRLRAGRMASAQPRAFIPTPVNAMDATERASIALLWDGATLGNKGRDYGIDLRYATDRAEAIVFLHNGDGSFNQLTGNIQDNIVGGIPGTDRSVDDLAVSFYGAVFPGGVPGLELGGFAGYNGNGNTNTTFGGEERSYFTYSAHAYWGALPGSQPIRLKGDLIGVQYEELDIVDSQDALGFSILGAFALHESAEVFGRFEMFDFNLDDDGQQASFITAGMSFSPSRLRGRPFAQERLTLAYNLRLLEDDDLPQHHLLILQAQLSF